MSDPNIKTAVALAEKELQEQEISKIKNIVKDYLKQIQEKEKDSRKLTKEISLLKKDLDNLKQGRLDLIEERQKIEPLSPKIIIIHRIEERYLPSRPWYSPFEIQYPLYPSWTSTTSGGTAGNVGINTIYTPATSLNNLTAYASALSQQVVGNTFKNFVGGSYDMGAGNIINL